MRFPLMTTGKGESRAVHRMENSTAPGAKSTRWAVRSMASRCDSVMRQAHSAQAMAQASMFTRSQSSGVRRWQWGHS